MVAMKSANTFIHKWPGTDADLKTWLETKFGEGSVVRVKAVANQRFTYELIHDGGAPEVAIKLEAAGATHLSVYPAGYVPPANVG
jgi:hypothetical protein